ncbi:MAG: TOBE domain-containing protein, partial [Burkholderiales bacterium]|nr:TOBE domain-containing protein [Burkholderiales bacterium]
DQVEAMTLAHRIVVFHAGRIEQVGTPMELYHRPANLFVAGFIGSPKMNFISATLESAAATEALLRLGDGRTIRAAVDATGVAAGTPVTVGVRPEHLATDGLDTSNQLPGIVQAAEHLGDVTYLYVDLPGASAPVVVRASPDPPLGIGDIAHLGVPPQRCHVFDPHGHA